MEGLAWREPEPLLRSIKPGALADLWQIGEGLVETQFLFVFPWLGSLLGDSLNQMIGMPLGALSCITKFTVMAKPPVRSSILLKSLKGTE